MENSEGKWRGVGTLTIAGTYRPLLQLRNVLLRKLPVGHMLVYRKQRGRALKMNPTKRRLLLEGYFSSLRGADGKKRYLAKLSVINGFDPYEERLE